MDRVVRFLSFYVFLGIFFYFSIGLYHKYESIRYYESPPKYGFFRDGITHLLFFGLKFDELVKEYFNEPDCVKEYEVIKLELSPYGYFGGMQFSWDTFPLVLSSYLKEGLYFLALDELERAEKETWGEVERRGSWLYGSESNRGKVKEVWGDVEQFRSFNYLFFNIYYKYLFYRLYILKRINYSGYRDLAGDLRIISEEEVEKLWRGDVAERGKDVKVNLSRECRFKEPFYDYLYKVVRESIRDFKEFKVKKGGKR